MAAASSSFFASLFAARGSPVEPATPRSAARVTGSPSPAAPPVLALPPPLEETKYDLRARGALRAHDQPPPVIDQWSPTPEQDLELAAALGPKVRTMYKPRASARTGPRVAVREDEPEGVDTSEDGPPPLVGVSADAMDRSQQYADMFFRGAVKRANIGVPERDEEGFTPAERKIADEIRSEALITTPRFAYGSDLQVMYSFVASLIGRMGRDTVPWASGMFTSAAVAREYPDMCKPDGNLTTPGLASLVLQNLVTNKAISSDIITGLSNLRQFLTKERRGMWLVRASMVDAMRETEGSANLVTYIINGVVRADKLASMSGWPAAESSRITSDSLREVGEYYMNKA